MCFEYLLEAWNPLFFLRFKFCPCVELLCFQIKSWEKPILYNKRRTQKYSVKTNEHLKSTVQVKNELKT